MHTLWLGRGPRGRAVARPMIGRANCRGLNHRVAQGFEHPTHGPFPPGLGWGWRSLWSFCTWSPSCDSQQLVELSPPHAISNESQLQAGGAPAPCRVRAALNRPETEAVLEGPGV